jgi:hypothetical protein
MGPMMEVERDRDLGGGEAEAFLSGRVFEGFGQMLSFFLLQRRRGESNE